jgi:hypothetical protein
MGEKSGAGQAVEALQVEHSGFYFVKRKIIAATLS